MIIFQKRAFVMIKHIQTCTYASQRSVADHIWCHFGWCYSLTAFSKRYRFVCVPLKWIIIDSFTTFSKRTKSNANRLLTENSAQYVSGERRRSIQAERERKMIEAKWAISNNSRSHNHINVKTEKNSTNVFNLETTLWYGVYRMCHWHLGQNLHFFFYNHINVSKHERFCWITSMHCNISCFFMQFRHFVSFGKQLSVCCGQSNVFALCNCPVF